MSEKFEVGEIAIVAVCRWDASWIGREVEIRSELCPHECGASHRVWVPWEARHFWARPDNLRKRPQLPDWNALAYSKPRDVETV